MTPGNKRLVITIFFLFYYCFPLMAEDKILSAPLINLNELKPSFEEEEDSIKVLTTEEKIQNKKIIKNDYPSSAMLIGLDKITAKTSKIIISMGETKKFGPLEIKVLKCGKIFLNDKDNSVAYLQVKDLSKNDNEKVFIFNGWTFSSDSTIAPFDHAIYDLQLVNCNKA